MFLRKLNKNNTILSRIYNYLYCIINYFIYIYKLLLHKLNYASEN